MSYMIRGLFDTSNFCMCSIYVIRNTKNNKVYVGQTWKPMMRRFQIHIQSSTFNHCIKLRRAIQKYGKENFSIKLLIFCHTEEMANHWEAYFIHKFDSVKSGYNTLEVGFSRKGTKHTQQTKRKMSLKQKGAKNGNSVLELWQVKLIRNEYDEFKNP